MKKKKNTLIWAGLVLLVVVVVLIISYPKIKQAWIQPLGPKLSLSQEETIPATTQVSDPVSSNKSNGQATGTDQLHTPTPTQQPLCGGPAEMTILAVGADSRPDNYLYGLADVIRIVHVDFTIPRVGVLTIPRDLWVEVPGISDHYGITHVKLNQSYFFGTPGMGYYDGSDAGAGLLARTLKLNFDLQVDHYGVVNMRTFEDIIDAVGGVDVFLEKAVDGRIGDSEEDNMGLFRAGWQHLTGEKALRLARIRKVDSDLNRANRQTLILCAFKDKLLSPSAITGLPQMISAFSDRVLTDLSPAELSSLACLIPKLSKENLVFASFPQDILVPTRVYDPQFKGYTYVFDVEFDLLADYIDQFLAGTWPDKTTDSGLSCPEYEKEE